MFKRFELDICPFPFCILLKQCVQWFSYFREIANKTSIEIGEPQKGSNIRDVMGNWPVRNTLNFDGIHHDLIVSNAQSKIFYLCLFEIAFLQFQIKLVLS